MELKFIKGSVEKWANFSNHNENSFYVIGAQDGDKIALYLGNELIASGNTVAALEAEISRAKAEEKRISDKLEALAGNGEGSVVEQIANALAEAKEYTNEKVSAETSAREAAVSALTETVEANKADIEGALAEAVEALEVADEAEAAARAAADSFLSGKIDTMIADAKTYSIVKMTEGLAANVKEAYKLVDDDGTQSGATIEIYKDSSLKSVALSGQKLQFTYILADGTEDTVGVDVSSFLAESEFADGLQVVDHVVSVKIAEDSESFLTVDEAGVKLSGVQTAINTAVEAEHDRAVSAETELNNAIVAEAKRADEAEKALGVRIDNEITARENADNAITAKMASDKSELEGMIAAASASATTKVAKDAEASHLTLSTTTAEDGSVTYTIGESDIASKSVVEQAIANEASARTAADNVLSGKIDTEISDREAAINSLSGTVDSHVETLNNAIVAEKERAEAAESGLTEAIKAETSAREAADKALSDRIAAFESGDTSVAQQIADAKAEIEGTLAEDDAKTLEAINNELNAIDDKIAALEDNKIEGEKAIAVATDEKGDTKVSLTLADQPTNGGVVLAQDNSGLSAKMYWGTI